MHKDGLDSHVHLANVPGMTPEQEQLHPDIARVARRQVPRSFLYFGFTTLVDLISTPGVTPAQIFHAVTLANAEAFRLDGEIGTVQIGKRANLLLLHEDPAQSIGAYANIAKVILGGRVLDPAELVANRTGNLPD